MAFKNELVPEEQKSKFDVKVFYNRMVSRDTPITFYRWVVDHERNAFVIGVGGGGPSQMGAGYSQLTPYYLVLSIKGQVIEFEATFDAEGDIKDKSVIETINVYKVQIPKELEKQKDEILDILKEALEAYSGSTGMPYEYVSAVHVKFN